MNAQKIYEYIRKEEQLTEINFAVCSADNLNKIKIIKPAGLIVNTDISFNPGKHWVSFFLPEEGPGEFFDSIGHSPDFYYKIFASFLIANSEQYIHNTERIQNFDSNYCGQYCLYFLSQRCEKITYQDFMSQFTSDFRLNDAIVLQNLKKTNKN